MKTQLNVTHIFFLSDLPKLPGKFTLTKKREPPPFDVIKSILLPCSGQSSDSPQVSVALPPNSIQSVFHVEAANRIQ